MKVLVLILLAALFPASGSLSGFPIEVLRFGYNGSTNGRAVSYSLATDGKLTLAEESMGRKNFSLIKTLDKKAVKQLYAKGAKLKDHKQTCTENFCYFVEIEMKNSTNRISWGSDTTKSDTAARALYRELTGLLKE